MSTCQNCKKDFIPKRDTAGKFCGYQCYWSSRVGKANPWGNGGGNTGYKHSEEHKKYMSQIMTGRKLPNMSGNNHPAWKGDTVSYRSLHTWVERQLGRPNKCNECKKIGCGHQIHWANVSGDYLRNVTDWLRLCARCHKNFDLTRNK